MRAFFLILAAALVCALTGRAQVRAGGEPSKGDRTEQYFFETFGEEAGFLQTDVILAITRARDGYLWLGTERGLTRFDGVRFVSFRASNTPGFANNLVICLHEDRDGTLWAGTERGVVRFSQGKFERTILPDAPIRAIVQDASGRIWIGTAGQGLFSWKDGVLTSHAEELKPYSLLIRCLFVDSRDRLWIGFQHYRGLVVREGGDFRAYESNGEIRNEVQAICEHPRGTLWLGASTAHRVFRLRGPEVQEIGPRHGLASSQVFDVRPAADGGLWIAAGALQHIADLENPVVKSLDRLPYDRVRTLHEDHEQCLWLNARDVGLVRARRLPYRVYGVPEGLPKSGIKTVSRDAAGNFWFATEDSTIGCFTPGRETQYFDLPMRANPASVIAAPDGGLWVSSSTALFHYAAGRWTPHTDIRGVYGIHRARDGTVWLGTIRGVARLREGREEVIPIEGVRPITRASAFCEAPDGSMYVGTWDAGLARIKGDTVEVFDHRNGLPTDHVRAVHVDADNRVWVGLRSRGLAVLEGGRWLNPHSLSEAVADHVSAILEDDEQRIWVGTPAGVMWAPKAELLAAARGETRAPRFRTIEATEAGTVAPVWSGAQPTAAKGPDGKLYFATRRGILGIDSRNLPSNQVPPPVRIETVTIDHLQLTPGAEIALAAGVRDLTIEYTALSLVQSKHIAFEYLLEGFDREWHQAGPRRTAFYSRLPPGTFNFRVRARNVDGLWSEQDALLRVRQEPYFHQTGGFYAAILTALAGIIWLAHHRRTAALRRENEKLNRLVANRTHDLELANQAIAARSRDLEEANRAKTEFLESVSHEIRNPLNGIIGLLGLLRREQQEPQARKLTDSIQACARALTRAFEEVLGFSKLEHGGIELKETDFSLRRLLEEVVAAFAWQAGEQGNRVSLEFSDGFVDGFSGDEAKIKTVVGNFLSNAIKYAPGKPIEIRVVEDKLTDDQADVHIEVCDHGPGISAEEQEKVFRKFVRGANAKKEAIAGTGLGLATCRLLAQSLRGSVGVESEPGAGATFYLCVPLRRASVPAEESSETFKLPGPRPGATALIVEDEHYNQVVLSGIALELGYAPRVANTVAEATACSEAAAFDVVLVDWELPDGEGGKVAERIRGRADGAKGIIIATTAYDSDEIRARCAASGMDDFILKPYDAAQVRECIERVLRRRSGDSLPPFAPAAPARAADGATLNFQAFQFYGRRFPERAGEAPLLYTESLELELRQLATALTGGDVKAVGAHAHRLHALGGLVGAQELVEAAKRLTALARSGAEMASLEPECAALTAAIERVKERVLAGASGK